MVKLRIKSIHLHNFKGFRDLNVDFNANGAIILGGKNGFGKTTLFDALELLLTGKIQRMTGYTKYHNHQYYISQEDKPLVHDKHYSDKVVVSATLKLEDKCFVIRRMAMVTNMKNPVDFSAFSALFLVLEDGSEKKLLQEDYKTLGIDYLCHTYSFLNYLSQEEATTFLKQKEVDRAEMLSKLFDLSIYEENFSKIEKVQKELKKQQKDWKQKQNEIMSVIKKLRSLGKNKVVGDTAYIQLTTDLEKCKWDKDNPQLSFEDYNLLLQENGILDGLTYLAHNKDEYGKYRENIYIDEYIRDEEIHNIALYVKYSNKQVEIELYKEYKERLVLPITSTPLENVEQYTFYLPQALMPYVSDETITKIVEQLKALQEQYKGFDSIQKAQSTIMELRNKLAKTIERREVPFQQCPLCGHDYFSLDDLLRSIETQGQLFIKQTDVSLMQLQKVWAILKETIKTQIINPISEYFEKEGITNNIDEEIRSIDRNKYSIVLKNFIQKFGISIDISQDLKTIEQKLKAQLSSSIKEFDKSLDYRKMDQMYASYGRYIKKDLLTVENIQKKRMFLTNHWNHSKSELLNDSEKRKQIVEKTLDNIDNRIKSFKSLDREIQRREREYLQKVLSDIKILFYVYSGRIMQDNYFGRGLFIREDLDRKRVLITSSKDKNNEVDALFNMSSGQLVSLVIALTLSLNKLYSTVSYIAVDDPIQTMDDINLWGLIETLRHDFNDHFILLSTHETDYGKLLEYKLRKWGIDTEYIEMSQLYKI